MNDNTKPLSKVIRIDESEIRGHLDEMVRGDRIPVIRAMQDVGFPTIEPLPVKESCREINRVR